MSTTEPNPTTTSFKLSCYFWLPAGIDEFELTKSGGHCFENTANYRESFGGSIAENAIAKNFADSLLKDDPHEDFQFDRTNSPLNVQDGNLGLQKLEYEFEYRPRRHKNQNSKFPEQLRGRGLILSNGLYLWQFDVEFPPDQIFQETKQLYEDFVKGPIARIFQFDWDENDENAYEGVLTYYQIDLLFNGIFDKDAHPTNFMEANLGGNEPKEARYEVGGIIKSVARFAINDYHFPLFDGLNGRSLETAFEREFKPTISTNTEWLVSRMSYAGMEQFLKIAVSSSLLHYKAGLDHCRTQVTNDSLLIRINKTAGELRRQSLSQDLSSADLQAYASIVAGKLPAFQFLYGMIEELAHTSRPTEVQKNNMTGNFDWAELAEWVHGRFTLRNNLLHYQLYVESIKNDITEINRGLDTVRTDEIIAELRDTRKLTEIAAESVNRSLYDRSHGQLEKLMVLLTRMALFFSFVQAYAAIGLWLMDRLLGDSGGGSGFFPSDVKPWVMWVAYGQWGVLVLLFIWFYRKWARRPERDTTESKKRKQNKHDIAHSKKTQRSMRGSMSGDWDGSNEIHIFDYSLFHQKLTHDAHSSAEMISRLAQRMPGIELDEDVSECASRSSFRETPLSAVERTKYTLESRESSKGNGSYVFHIEVDRRMGRNEEYLREVRLAIKRPVGVQYSVVDCAQHIIYKCLNCFLFEFNDQEQLLELLDKQFYGTELTARREAVRKYEAETSTFTKDELTSADEILNGADNVLKELGVTPTGVTLVWDTDVLRAAEGGDRTIWAVLRRDLDRGGQVFVVPAKVLNQVPQDEPQLSPLLSRCVIERPLNEHVKREAELLLRNAGISDTEAEIINAHIVLTALQHRAVVLVSRPYTRSIQRLAAAKKTKLPSYPVDIADQPELPQRPGSTVSDGE